VQAHAEALRAQQCFAEVTTGLLNGTPSVTDALVSLTSHVVHVVPFFMEEGWFVREVIPRALGDGSGHELRYHSPVGVHPAVAKLVAERVRQTCGAAAAQFSVLLVGHGSARAPGRQMALHRHAEVLRARERFGGVRAAFLEEQPLVAEALLEWRAVPVALVGCFAGEGGHVRNDLPALIAAERMARGDSGAPLLDLGVVGDDVAMPGIILDQVAGAR
jgi:sirohydrochlorin cobaltochelatase